MAEDMLNIFVNGLKNAKNGGIITSVRELRENQYGIPWGHYCQQYLYGATGTRIQVFNSLQGDKGVHKSTSLYDFMGYVTGDKEHGGLEGVAFLYEMEFKINPAILYSMLSNYGERATQYTMLRTGMTLEQALSDFNTVVIPTYMKACPKLDRPLVVGFDSIGGSSSADTIEKLKKGEETGKGYYNKQHFMKYFCENQGNILMMNNVPVVIICINQEREQASSVGFGPPQKKITGGTAQAFKDGYMISYSRKPLPQGDGNLVYMRTAKSSYCDTRKIEVEFRWNKYGQKTEDAYEAHFLWALASARCLADPEKGVGDIRDICDVKISDSKLVTCPQLGVKSVTPEEFEQALFGNEKVLDQLYTYQKIERIQDLSNYPEYVTRIKARNGGKPEAAAQPVAEAKPKPAKPKKAVKKQELAADVDTTELIDSIMNTEKEAADG